MKNIILFFLLIFITSCKKSPNFYHGIVMDEYKKAMDSVIVKELPVVMYPQSTITFDDGSFKLYRDKNLINSLIFFKKGYITDTLKTAWSQYGETEEYLFLNKIPDTIVLKKVK